MRITSGSYYNNIYGENNKLNKQLFDVNKQISSGLKIQYAHEDPTIFIDTLRLDDEITTLTQVKNSAQSAYKLSTQTDKTIGEIVKTLESMKVKMVNAANDAHSDTSIQAIAKELRGLKNHLLTLANTSIGGQYLFSGTATSVKPIGEDEIYQGNDQNLEAFLGSGIKQKYNISGSQLFLGDESKVNRTITTNIAQKSLTDLYPDIMQDAGIPRNAAKETFITDTHTIRDLMGDTDAIADSTTDPKSHFYIQGTRHDGSTFKTHISMNSDETVNNLMGKISDLYGKDQVDVTLNTHGQIEIVDKISGSSKLDFHMVGAVDFSGGGAANVNTIDALQTGSTDFETAAITAPGLYVKEFTKSGLDTPASVTNTIEGINYDRTFFEKDGGKLISNVSQIIKGTNQYAESSTKLLDVAGVAPIPPALTSTLDGKTLNIEGDNIDGISYNIQIDLSSASTVSGTLNGVPITPFNIYNADPSRSVAAADDVTYQQLTDIINMIVTNNLPTSNDAVAYDTAIDNSNADGEVKLDDTGRIIFRELNNTKTKANLSIYDDTSSNYDMSTVVSSETSLRGASLMFNSNSSLTIRDPKTDFFAQIEEMIRSVEQGKKRSDGTDSNDPRNIGIQNSIAMIDDLSDHVSRLQTEAGSYSQVLQASSDRTDMLLISTKTLQSDVIDTDIAEATLRMQQLSLNYQALLSNISKVSKLSLVNYL